VPGRTPLSLIVTYTGLHLEFPLLGCSPLLSCVLFFSTGSLGALLNKSLARESWPQNINICSLRELVLGENLEMMGYYILERKKKRNEK
jgi:hypothetical protein